MDPSSTFPQSPTTRPAHAEDWKPHKGPQTRFLGLTCREALYGGAAGGGKSDALLIDAIRYVGRGYGGRYAALLLRREFPDLEMSLMRRAHDLYPRIGGKWKGDNKTWYFPRGETVRFGHAQHELDVHHYQGADFQFVGFDEVTTFTEYQYKYLISRLRSAHGVPCRLRGATNPGGQGHDWVFKRFGPWLDPDCELRAEPGEVLYFTVDSDGNEQHVPKGTPDARGRTFVPARLADNPHLAKDGEYERALLELDPLTRAQLKDGNWLAKPAAGLFFRRSMFTIVDAAPIAKLRVRWWDRAATVAAPGKDPDWTVGLRYSRDAEGFLYVEDVVRLRGAPRDVQKTILATAAADGVGTTIAWPVDPGQAGVYEASAYSRALQSYRFVQFRETGDKATRAGPVSGQAAAGNIRLVKGPWIETFLRELEQFPEGNHDDQVDALSGAHMALTATPAQPRRDLSLLG